MPIKFDSTIAKNNYNNQAGGKRALVKKANETISIQDLSKSLNMFY